MARLCDLKCSPCQGDVAPLKGEALAKWSVHLKGWDIIDEHHLSKTLRFPDFVAALSFVNRVGMLAEAEGHHPDIQLSWGKVTIELHTHKIGGLSENDFILAAKIDASGG
jgi:4a-hydroxytetrahydrobiopterin dehydratase